MTSHTVGQVAYENESFSWERLQKVISLPKVDFRKDSVQRARLSSQRSPDREVSGQPQ